MFSSKRRAVTRTGALAALVVGALAACTSPGGATTPSVSASVTPSDDTTASPTPTTTATPTPAAPPSQDPAATDAPPQETPPPVTAGVVVVSSGWEPSTASVEVTGLVPVLEEGGTCTLTLTQGARRATVEAQAVPASTTTSCPVLAVPRDQLGVGTWDAVLTYRSAGTSMTSAAFRIEVPA